MLTMLVTLSKLSKLVTFTNQTRLSFTFFLEDNSHAFPIFFLPFLEQNKQVDAKQIFCD